MKNKRPFLLTLLPVLSLSFISSCGNNNYEEEQRHLEVGDIVKEWKSRKDLDDLPIDLPKEYNGSGSLVKNFGHEDKSSLYFEVNGSGYLGSDTLIEPYFIDDDAKNGDIISMYVYVPKDGNIDYLELEVLPISMNNGFKDKQIKIDDENKDKWVRTLVTFDSLETLGAIRLNYASKDDSSPSNFYVDDISIMYGEETVKTGYEYNDESLYQAYEGKLKIGTCISSNGMRNNMLRTIVKDNFNSITAENEGKPEQILDKAACQASAKKGFASDVCIKIDPIEKMYDFAEAHHIGVRHHTFVWYSQTPNWFFTQDYSDNGPQASRDLMLARMENFIRVTLETINERWPGLVYAVDVANEAISDNDVVIRGENSYDNNKWYDTVGDDFVYYAFKYANKYKEDYQDLYYNDYTYDNNIDKCKLALDKILAKAIDEQLIDGVGLQAHVGTNEYTNLIENAKLVYQKGLKCQITELEMSVYGGGSDEEQFRKQKDAFKGLMKLILEKNYLEETDINAFVVWGITDDTSWKYHQGQKPLLFDTNYGKKPGYYGLMEAIEEYDYE